MASQPPVVVPSVLGHPHKTQFALLRVAMKYAGNRWMFQRYQAVILVLKGYPYREVSEIIGRSIATVCHYVQTFRRGGLEVLEPRHSHGRPRRLSTEQEQTVADLGHLPDPGRHRTSGGNERDGAAGAALDSEPVRGHGFRTGVRHLLYRLGFACTRPTYTLAKADPEKQAAFREAFERQRERLLDGDIDRILFEDESMIRDDQAVQRTWFPKGQQKVIPTFGKHWGDKLLGTLDDESGEILCRHATP